MITLYITDRQGNEQTLPAPTDMAFNLMELCRAANLPVEGTCGGMALCATCQVYILSEHPLPPPTDDELAMLDQAFHVQPNSRLGCQIRITEQLDGLRVQLAPE
jgi:2Fe-2S ferredoxin